MNFSHIHEKFTHAIFWNGISYIAYKITSLILLYTLYQKLSTDYFSTWASLNAFLFATLIFIDFGFRKSIPRFAPIFLRSEHQTNFFINIFFIQFFILLISSYPFSKIINYYVVISLPSIFYIFLFISEGIKNFIQIFYHSHFKQKDFTIISSLSNFLETLVIIFYFYQFNQNTTEYFILIMLIKLKVFINIFIILASLIWYIKNIQNIVPYEKETFKPESKNIITPFLKHSLFIWFSTIIKILTERNILFLYITFYFDTTTANTFKVCYESAVSFQRIIIKTIGTADTSFLSYIHTNQNSVQKDKHTYLQEAIKVIVKTIKQLLFIIIIGILTISYISSHIITQQTHQMILIFNIISISYIIETLLSPYERILEVQKSYLNLLIGYIPYLIIISITILLHYYKIINPTLIQLIFIIQFARLISSIIMWCINFKKRDIII